jgi:predicted DNA-binding transcriptional regulator AlpA
MEQEDNRPLFSLTVEEFKELSKTIQLDLKYLHPDYRKEVDNTEDIIYASEAAKLAGYTESTLYTKVSRREIPVLSGGRPLTFSKKQLIAWIEAGRPSLIEMKVKDFMKNQKGEI